MDVLIKTHPQDDPVFPLFNKKRAQGKPYYVYMTVGANKFLRIYYRSSERKSCISSRSLIIFYHLQTSTGVVGLFWYLIFNLYTIFIVLQFNLDFLFAGFWDALS